MHLLTKNTFPKQTRTEETLRDYLTFVEQFVRREQELHDLPPDQRPSERQMADFFVEHKPTLCASSWRRCEAAIRAKIDHDGEWQHEVPHDLLSARAREAINAGSALPASEKRTSRKKQEEVAFDDMMKLVHELRRPSNVKTREAIRHTAEWANKFPPREAFETAIATRQSFSQGAALRPSQIEGARFAVTHCDN